MKVGGWGICAVVGGWEGRLKVAPARKLALSPCGLCRAKPNPPKKPVGLWLSRCDRTALHPKAASFLTGQAATLEASPPRPSPHVNSLSHCCLHTRFCGAWRFAGGGNLNAAREVRSACWVRFENVCPFETGLARLAASQRRAPTMSFGG